MNLLHSADILWFSTARESDHICHVDLNSHVKFRSINLKFKIFKYTYGI